MAPKKKRRNNSSDEDELESLCNRYPSAPQVQKPATKPTGSGSGSGSGTLAPSKSTLYVSNLDYSLTNSDLHTLFSRFGKIARVTVLKDRETRQSRGVAFVQFVTRGDAVTAAGEMHGKILNGRKLSASIAADNGRAAEFIKKREYKDKSRTSWGPRERPPQKKGRRGGGGGGGGGEARVDNELEWESGGETFEDDNWASVVDGGAGQRLLLSDELEEEKKRKKIKKAGYFSDESDHDDEE
ncbi:hypothetical protein M0R45_036999 [Rubus argutus]|uniref:RRM domain-containing protein n=1 Tax=Rubus argutus TaxID=59490 RepID=A0AAW1VZF2_RUBAR